MTHLRTGAIISLCLGCLFQEAVSRPVVLGTQCSSCNRAFKYGSSTSRRICNGTHIRSYKEITRLPRRLVTPIPQVQQICAFRQHSPLTANQPATQTRLPSLVRAQRFGAILRVPWRTRLCSLKLTRGVSDTTALLGFSASPIRR